MPPQLELSLLYSEMAKDSALFAFYIDDIFGAFKFYQKQYIFLHNHFYLCLIWSQLKLVFPKLKIGMTKIFALRKEYEIGGRVKLKPDRIKKILNWPIPQDQTAVRAFLDTIQFIQC